MTDNNIKFKIKSYIEILKYTEDKDERERILGIINEYLDNYDDFVFWGKPSPKLDEVKRLIINNMPEGKCRADEILTILSANGISKGTIDRAKKHLGIISIREGGLGTNGTWYWIMNKKFTLHSNDSVNAFIRDCIIDDQGSRIKRIILFGEYEDYCHDQNYIPLKKKGFYQSMRARGYSEVKTNGDNCFKDIAFCRCIRRDAE